MPMVRLSWCAAAAPSATAAEAANPTLYTALELNDGAWDVRYALDGGVGTGHVRGRCENQQSGTIILPGRVSSRTYPRDVRSVLPRSSLRPIAGCMNTSPAPRAFSHHAPFPGCDVLKPRTREAE